MNDYLKHRLALKNGDKVIPDKKRQPVKKLSEKQKLITREYLKLREKFLREPENKMCQAKVVCGGKKRASEVHHVEGRSGKKMLDPKTWMPVCSACHRHIHDNDGESLEKGLKRSRITKPDK